MYNRWMISAFWKCMEQKKYNTWQMQKSLDMILQTGKQLFRPCPHRITFPKVSFSHLCLIENMFLPAAVVVVVVWGVAHVTSYCIEVGLWHHCSTKDTFYLSTRNRCSILLRFVLTSPGPPLSKMSGHAPAGLFAGENRGSWVSWAHRRKQRLDFSSGSVTWDSGQSSSVSGVQDGRRI